MKLVYTAIIIGISLSVLYVIFKDFAFSSLSWRKKEQDMKIEDEEYKKEQDMKIEDEEYKTNK